MLSVINQSVGADVWSGRPARLINVAVVFAMLSLAGCATTSPKWPSEEPAMQDVAERNASTAGNFISESADLEAVPPSATRDSVIYQGEVPKIRSAVKSAGTVRHTPAGGGDILLNFVDTPVRDAVQLILGDHLQRNFTVDSEVDGAVNLNNKTGLRKSDLLPTLRTLLNNVDARLVQQGDDYQVVRGADKAFSAGGPGLEIIPLRYIDAAEFAKVLTGYQVSATVIEPGNLLAVSGSGSKLDQVRQLARSFDVNWLKGMSVGLFAVHNTSATVLRRELLELFGKDIQSDVSGILRIVAIERSNSILIISPQDEYVSMMGDWINRLDNTGGEDSQGFYIYRVQNGKAGDLAELLRGMFGTEVASTDNAFEPENEMGTAVPEVGNFRVIADDSTNSLIVTGSPHYYQLVRTAMEQLDSTPLQVLVEARIMELTLSDELQYGLEWYLQGSRASSDTSARLDLGNTGIGFTAPGFSYVVERAGEIRAALNGLAEDSRLKVLSSPSLMVLNNQTASILVGDEVPIPTRQATSNISPDAPTVNEIEYRNTGILLTVTPRVNSGGMVTMDISQEVSSVANNTTSEIDAPTIQQRRLNSTVSIQSGQTVVLGGLIREQNSGSESGVPVLKDIPGLGKLFSSTTNRVQRTELVALITPRVIEGGEQTDAITDEYRRKMLGLRPIPITDL